MKKRVSYLIIGFVIITSLVWIGRVRFDIAEGSYNNEAIPNNSTQKEAGAQNQAGVSSTASDGLGVFPEVGEVAKMKVWVSAGSGSCNGMTCTVPLNSSVTMTVAAYDTFDKPITGVPVSYVWTIVNPQIGSFSTGGTSKTDTSSNGMSSQTINSGSIPASSDVTIIASYGGVILPAFHFTIASVCTYDPLLLEGKAKITVDGKSVSSTADVLYTYMAGCRDEYKLKPGTAETE